MNHVQIFIEKVKVKLKIAFTETVTHKGRLYTRYHDMHQKCTMTLAR